MQLAHSFAKICSGAAIADCLDRNVKE